MKPTTYVGTAPSDTQQRKNMTTMGKVDTSDCMMAIRWIIDISSEIYDINLYASLR